MNTLLRILFINTCLLIGSAGYAQTVEPPYEVATWQGFRNAAVSYTFDDGSPKQFTVAIPMFNEFNFKSTLFTITGSWGGWPANWTTLQNVAAQGHEIASHTVTHTSLGGMADSTQTKEFENSQNTIQSYITSTRCATIAYPYCVAGNDTICDNYYIAARICSQVIEPSTPTDFMSISSIICGPEGQIKTTQNFIDRFNSALSPRGWCVLLLHGIDGDGGWSSLSSTILRESLEYLNSNQDKFWVSSFGNIARYIKERNAASVTEIAADDTSFIIQVTDPLDNAVFNYPLTIRRPLPEGWPSAIATQNGHAIPVLTVKVQSSWYIQFDAVPDSGDVIIAKGTVSAMQHDYGTVITVPILWQNYPNPFNPSTTINFELPRTEDVRLRIFDTAGREVMILVNENLPAGHHSLRFEAASLASGLYFYHLQVPGFLLQRKMLLLR
jgi:hypothetical protein